MIFLPLRQTCWPPAFIDILCGSNCWHFGPLMPPIELKTTSGPLVQMTANGIHTELMSETDILARLEAVMGSPENGPPKAGATRHLFIGFPMETIAISLPKLEFALQEIFKRSSETKTPLRWTAENLSKASANAH